MQEEFRPTSQWDVSGLRAVCINCTLKRSPSISNAKGSRTGTQRTAWDAGSRLDHANPEYR